MELPTTTREFWKHTVYGDIYAVELVITEGQRDVLGVLKCSRPEQQTRGALPVLTLDASSDGYAGLVASHRADFSMWEPPMTRDDAIEHFRVKVNATRTAFSDYDRIRKQERAANKHLEKCQAEEHAAAVLLVDPPADPPLIAMAEARPVDPPPPPGELTAEDFDAAFGGDHDDTGDDAQPEPPPE